MCVLSVAGSDSGGGAGIQADLKTFHSLGVYGATIITALTAQNTVGVQKAVAVEPELVKAQFDAVFNDLNISALKTGMLANSEVIKAVVEKLREQKVPWVVIDPVLAATSGDLLLEKEAVSTVIKELIPIGNIITPNIPEAEILTGIKIDNFKHLEQAALKILGYGADYVLIKGGHASGDAVDYLFNKEKCHRFSAARVGQGSLHGTGCTLSAAICAYLSKTDDLVKSVQLAKNYVTRAINECFSVGKGSKVLNHWYPKRES
jgi:hydroxymethylpyrimidine/phosphomethylpyrimidine kinase